MKKSKIITIALLALSIGGCHKKRSQRPPLQGWNNAGDSYVSSDGGMNYQQANSAFPFWFYYYILLQSNGRYGYASGSYYYYRNSHYHGVGSRAAIRAGRSFGGKAYGHGSMRGGFGSSGRSVVS